MNYATIKNCDIANGPGVRVSLFVSGCTHRCPGCFNEVAWDFDYGQPFTQEVMDSILDMLRPSYIRGLTLLGGEPFEPQNQGAVVQLLRRADAAFLRFLGDVLSLRFFLLVILQTAVFAAIYTVLPNRRNRFGESLPGALLASCGWLIFSNLYSVYVEHFAHLSNVYGSVYAVALSMLWLYCCISILFYGGALNRLLLKE